MGCLRMCIPVTPTHYHAKYAPLYTLHIHGYHTCMVSHHVIDMLYRNAQSAKAINLHAVNLHIVMRCGIYIDACVVALYRIK